jgi:hypothetical protein
MTYNALAGISVATSAASTTFYQLTDHNRQPITMDYDVLEKAARMADGTMRKYVVARKRKVSVNWQDLPSGTGVPISDYDVIKLTPYPTVADVWTNSTGSANTVTPGQSYTATANIRRTLATAGNSYIRIDWKKADGSSNGDTGATNILSINNSSWTQLSVTATAPANTAYAIIVVNATPASITDYIYVKSVTFAGNFVATSRFVDGTNTTISLTYFTNLNSGYTMTVDGNRGGAWIKSFYEQNVFKPIVVKVIHSKDTASTNLDSAFYPSPNSNGESFNCFMTSFKYDIIKRYTLTDLVNVSIEFTEI